MAAELEACWGAACEGRGEARAATVAIAPWLFARMQGADRADLLRSVEERQLPLASALLGTGPARREIPRHAWTGELRVVSFLSFVRPPRELGARRWAALGVRGPSALLGRATNIHRRQLPAVLALLDVPALTRRTVVGMASERPLAPEIATALARHDRWWAEPEVRAAIVANPFAPPELVLPLLPVTRDRELKELARRTGVVGRGARAVLERRSAAP